MDLEPLKIDPALRARRRSRRGRWVFLAALLAGVAWLGLGPLRPRLEALFVPEVSVERVRRRDPGSAGAGEVSANGYVVARTRAALSADTPGRIVAMNVEEGSVVHEGDVVARLFSEEYEAALQRAQADLALAEASLARSRAEAAVAEQAPVTLRASASAAEADVGQYEAQLELARLQLERAENLLASQVDSAQRRDEAQSERASAEARLAWARAQHEAARGAFAEGESRLAVAQAAVGEAEAAVGSARAARELARATLDKTNVRAPFDGIVVLKDAEVGEVVSPNVQGGSNARGSVITMVDFRSLEVQAEVPETSLAAVRLGAPVRVHLDAWPEDTYKGRVSRIWPTANRTKATVEVRIALERLDERLRPEMGVRIVFLEREAGTDEVVLVLVPERALAERDGGRGVFVLDGERVRFRILELGEARGAERVVAEGLAGGEEVVLDPPADLADGARVRRATGA